MRPHGLPRGRLLALGASAACSVAVKSVDSMKGQVDAAIDQIGVDPAAAEKKLTGLRDGVRSAERRVGGDPQAKLADARVALDNLVSEAHDAAKGAAEGADVDTSALATSKQQFSDAVDAAGGAC